MDIVRSIETLFRDNFKLYQAPVYPNLIDGLMAFKNERPKYSLDAQGRLSGLNLSETGLDDEKWQLILALLTPENSSLQALNLSYNRLSSFEVDERLASVEKLDLSNNRIRAIDFKADDIKLVHLDLSQNQLEEFEFQKVPRDLQILGLNNNRLQRLPRMFTSLANLERLYLDENPLAPYIPEEVIKKGKGHNAASEVLSYLRSFEKSERQYLHEAKLVLVGNGEVGKTSIRIRLNDKIGPLPTKKQRTPLLDIERYMVHQLDSIVTGLEGPIDFQLNIWDFGGQGKYREMQQLFCSRKTMYLFVTACDDSPQKDDYIGFQYWLDMVNAFGYNPNDESFSPVIYVLNKMDLPEGKKTIDESQIKALFPNVEEFIKTSCETLDNFDFLEKTIRIVLPRVTPNIFSEQYSMNWLAVKSELESLRLKHHISYQEYQEISRKHNLDQVEADNWLDTLDRIGTVIYFGDNKELEDWIILDPNWIRIAIYQLLSAENIIMGKVYEHNFENIWRDHSIVEQSYVYTVDDRRHLKSLIKAFGFSFERSDNQNRTVHVVPSLLDESKPTLPEYLRTPGWEIRFVFDPFLPAGMVNKLMVRLHSLIDNDLMWKNNVIFHQYPSTYGHVWEDWQNKHIYLSLFSYQDKIGSLYREIKSSLKEIIASLISTKYLKELEFGVEVRSGEEWVNEKYIRRFENKQKFDFLWEGHGSADSPLKIAISYAREDGQDGFYTFNPLNELIDNLSIMKAQGIFAPFYDADINENNWDSQIREKFKEADLIIVLNSKNYNKGSKRYIWDVEIPIIKGKMQEKGMSVLRINVSDSAMRDEVKDINDFKKGIIPSIAQDRDQYFKEIIELIIEKVGRE